MFDEFTSFVRELYDTDDYIPLHVPRFSEKEKEYVLDAINSTYVSSLGEFVNDFENAIAEYTGIKNAIATVNGTAALHLALILAGVKSGEEVITQSFTFVATCNSIHYCHADPVFVDIDKDTLGLSPKYLTEFLDVHCEIRDDGYCWNKVTNKIIRACVPMHTFGFPVYLDEISSICKKYNIVLIEDAAESLGSMYKGKHTGSTGKLGIFSFNGNKIITTGGGGMILTNDDTVAARARHLTTTAKVQHEWHFYHDEVGYNYRLPNINAALGIAQIQSLPLFIEQKRYIAEQYQKWGQLNGIQFINEPPDTRANYWLNAMVTKDLQERDEILEYTNSHNVMTRPAWTPMHKLAMNQNCMRDNLENTEWLFERLVNVPSSVPKHFSQ